MNRKIKIEDIKYKNVELVEKLKKLTNIFNDINKSANNRKKFDDEFVNSMLSKTNELVKFIKKIKIDTRVKISNTMSSYNNNMHKITNELIMDGHIPNYETVGEVFDYHITKRKESINLFLQLIEYLIGDMNSIKNVISDEKNIINKEIAKFIINGLTKNRKMIENINELLLKNIKQLDKMLKDISIFAGNYEYDFINDIKFVQKPDNLDEYTMEIKRSKENEIVNISFYNDVDTIIQFIQNIIITIKSQDKIKNIANIVDTKYKIDDLITILQTGGHTYEEINEYIDRKKKIRNEFFNMYRILQNLNNLVEIYIVCNSKLNTKFIKYNYFQIYIFASIEYFLKFSNDDNKSIYKYVDIKILKHYGDILLEIKNKMFNANSDKWIKYLNQYHSLTIDILHDFITKLIKYMNNNDIDRVIYIFECKKNCKFLFFIFNVFKNILDMYHINTTINPGK